MATQFLAILVLAFCVTCIPSGSVAADAVSTNSAAATSPPATAQGLVPLDWCLIALYACVTIGLGVYYSRRQESTSEYFVGSGRMNPMLIGVSLFATLLSTISYLSMPGEAAGKGPVFLVHVLAYPFCFLVVGYVMLPVYMKHRVTSAYELLEEHLGISVRLLGASMFLLLRVVWMSILVYAAAKAMSVMMGVGAAQIPWIVVVVGSVAVIYTTLGGLRAVVITDFMQTVLLFGGALMVIGSVTWSLKGFSWFPTQWQDNWDVQPVLSFDPEVRITWVGTLLAVFLWNIATAGGDQTAVQRFMCTEDANAARRAYAVQISVAVVVAITLFITGFALLGYFQERGLPPGYDLTSGADNLFPWYIAYGLPSGISGLVVSAMFAAAMSSMDSGINSITAVVTTDFLDRFGWKPKTERGHVRMARLMALVIGVIVISCSSFVQYIPGNLTEITNKVVNLLPPSIFALFVFALFIRRSTPAGVWVGTLAGVATAGTVAFSGPLVNWAAGQFGVDPGLFGVELIWHTDPATGATWTTAPDPISFQWMSPASLIVTFSVGLLVSFVTGRGGRGRQSNGTRL